MLKNVGVALLILILSSCSKTSVELTESSYETGLSALAELDFDAARKAFGEIYAIDSNSIEARYGFALADETELKQFEALNSYFEIVNTNPEFTQAREGIVRILDYLDMPQSLLSAAVDLSGPAGENGYVTLIVADALIKNRMYEQATIQLDKLEQSGWEPGMADLVRAILLTHQNQFEPAAALVTQACEDNDSSPIFLEHLADYLENVGAVDSAMLISAQAAEAAPDDLAIGRNHFKRAIRLNYFAAAERLIRNIEERDASRFLIAALREYYYSHKGEPVMARMTGTELNLLEPPSLTGVVTRLKYLSKQADMIGIAISLDNIEVKCRESAYAGAFQVFLRQYLFGQFIKSGDLTSSIRMRDGLLEANISAVDMEFLLASLYNLGGNRDGFDEAMVEIESTGMDDPIRLTKVADVYGGKHNNRYALAEKHYNSALKLNGWYRPAFENLIAMLRKTERYEDAIAIFARFPHYEGQFPALAIDKALLLVASGQVDAGTKLFESTIRMVRGQTGRFDQLMIELNKRRQHDRRRSIVDLMMTLTPENHHALLLAAKWKAFDKDYSAELQFADKVVAENPDNLDGLAHQARAWYWLGQREKAFNQFDTLMVRDRGNCLTNYYYSQILAHEKIDLRRAANMARKALFGSDRSLEYRLNLVWVYFQGDRYDLAADVARTATLKYADQAEPFYWYGMALKKLGEKDARTNLSRAVELGLEGDLLQKAKEALAQL